jgi:hypothetical protein
VVGLEPRRAPKEGEEDKWGFFGPIGFQFVAIEAATVLAHICVMFVFPSIGLW